MGIYKDTPQPALIEYPAIDRFAALGEEGAVKPNHGSAAAWIAHLDPLNHIPQPNYSTAAIFEDDVDWSVTIKEQMATFVDEIREYPSDLK